MLDPSSTTLGGSKLNTNLTRDQYWCTAGNVRLQQHKYILDKSCDFTLLFSAGVGRTGTLIAIDIALAQASKERQVDIPKIIVDMRKQRMKMVQTVVRKTLRCSYLATGTLPTNFNY